MILGTFSREPAEREGNTGTGRREVPIVGPRGLLTYGDRSVCLSARNASLADTLVHHFGTEVTDLELLDRGWPKGATRRQLRVRLRRLDRRMARVGLRIADSGYRSHALVPVDDDAPGPVWFSSSADEEQRHLGSVHEPVRDGAEQ
jgi:hypothetical protein